MVATKDRPKEKFSQKDILFRFPAFAFILIGLIVYGIDSFTGNCTGQTNSISVFGANFTGSLSGLLITVGIFVFGLSIAKDVLSVYKLYRENENDKS